MGESSGTRYQFGLMVDQWLAAGSKGQECEVGAACISGAQVGTRAGRSCTHQLRFSHD